MPELSPIESYALTAREAIDQSVDDYTLRWPAGDHFIETLPPYQINEPGFRPLNAAKSSPQELRSELGMLRAEAGARRTDLGVTDEVSLRKLALQNGIGIDCSRFVFHVMTNLYTILGAGNYAGEVYLSTATVRESHRTKKSWQSRELTGPEQDFLASHERVSAQWVHDVFGKNPAYLIGSRNITDSSWAAEPVDRTDLLPGDLVAFDSATKPGVSHVAVVANADTLSSGTTYVDVWHSWHTRGFDAGLREDNATILEEGTIWNHPGLGDTERYSGYYFCRPTALAHIVRQLRQVPATETVAA